MKATHKQVFDEATFDQLKSTVTVGDIKPILCGSEMSENHLGGDDLVMLANDIVQAITDGFTVTAWYGPNMECLVVAYNAELVTIVGETEPQGEG